jgi:hypothetical protein
MVFLLSQFLQKLCLRSSFCFRKFRILKDSNQSQWNQIHFLCKSCQLASTTDSIQFTIFHLGKFSSFSTDFAYLLSSGNLAAFSPFKQSEHVCYGTNYFVPNQDCNREPICSIAFSSSLQFFCEYSWYRQSLLVQEWILRFYDKLPDPRPEVFTRFRFKAILTKIGPFHTVW